MGIYSVIYCSKAGKGKVLRKSYCISAALIASYYNKSTVIKERATKTTINDVTLLRIVNYYKFIIANYQPLSK